VTDLAVLIGHHIGYSASPAMHNAAFAVLGLDAVYVPLRCDEARLPPLMRALVEAGGGGNVTIPHKAAAAAAVDRMDGPLPGACNVFLAEDGRLVGHNTDVAGILAALERMAAPPSRWLLLGTGGGARAVVAAACQAGAALAVRSRSEARARALRAEVHAAGVAEAVEAECEVVVNATPLGLGAADPLPITPFETPAARWVLDLVYAPGATQFVRAYRERGVCAEDGREVLVAQGARALELWYPGARAPVDAMRAAVRGALG